MYEVPFKRTSTNIYPSIKSNIDKLTKMPLFSINPEIASKYAITLKEVFAGMKPNTAPIVIFGAKDADVDKWLMSKHPYQQLYFFDSRYENESEEIYNEKNIKVGERYAADMVNEFDIVKELKSNPNTVIYSFVKSNLTNGFTIDLIIDLKKLRTLSSTHKVYEVFEFGEKKFLTDIAKVQLSKLPVKDTINYLIGFSRFYTDSVLIISSNNK